MTYAEPQQNTVPGFAFAYEPGEPSAFAPGLGETGEAPAFENNNEETDPLIPGEPAQYVFGRRRTPRFPSGAAPACEPGLAAGE